MKKILMIAAMMIATLSANAQNEVGQITLKPMAGINLATMTKTTDSKMRVGLAAGIEGEYGLTEDLGITAGVLYSMQGVKGTTNIAGVKVDQTYKLDYINIPILANYYIIKGLAIKAGIQPAFKVSAKAKFEGSYGGVKASEEEDIDGTKGFYLSVPFGLSYEISNFVIDARYNLGVTKAIKDIDSKHSWFTFTLGYKFAL